VGDGSKPRILIVFAHPAPERAPVHPAMLKIAQEHVCEVRDLYELYPDFVIDVEAEQAAIGGKDLIVLQYPMHWFTPPAMMVEWLDAVFLRGFAYGADGGRLKDLTLLCAMTTGARARDFEDGGINRYSMAEFLRPLEQMSRRCGMRWAEPFIVHDTTISRDKSVDRGAERWRARLDAVAAEARVRREKLAVS
jgi:glutathione-regulated potassium-efflux system ancillary protein KefG